MQREGYWDYMGRRLREARVLTHEVLNHEERAPAIMSSEDIFKKELAEMQGYVHKLQMRIIELNKEVTELKYKIELIGHDSNQLELDLKNAHI